MTVYLINPSHVSFGIGVITPRWLYVLASATPALYGEPRLIDETLETFDANADLLGLVQDLTLLAMVGIVDPPRSEAKTAIAMCKSAGIRVRMITGDHAVTAAAIGRELGIEGRALTGAEFASMSDDVLSQQLPEIGIVARVAPEDKIHLVRLL